MALNIIVVSYFIIGFILTICWWNNEYQVNYEVDEEENFTEIPMAILYLLMWFFFWPIKMIINLMKQGFFMVVRLRKHTAIFKA